MTTATGNMPPALIIEDDDKLSIIFTEALRQAGFDARVIHDGAEALTAIQTCRPDVVILDLHLPHISGDEILKAIRRTENLALTRVIITTADAVLAETLRPHCDLILIKPISFLQLRDIAKAMRADIIATAD
jgi:two-component system cell cycle response regulator DivK